jgi:hypothetical protein
VNWSNALVLTFGTAILLGASGLGFLLWLFHRHHADVSDEPVRLPTETPLQRSRRDAIVLTDGQRCPCCHGDLAFQEGLHACRECSTVMHWECYRELGCPTMGCSAAFSRREDERVGDGKGKDDGPPVKASLKA